MNPTIPGAGLLVRLPWRLVAMICLALVGATSDALAHAVAEGDKGYIQEVTGIQLLPFVYLGAKHMVTGYDHILFLFGVIFFLYRLQHIAIYVSLFALGHSTTMLKRPSRSGPTRVWRSSSRCARARARPMRGPRPGR